MKSGNQTVLDEAINKATLNVFNYLKANSHQWHFKLAILVEPFNQETLTSSDYVAIYDYLYAHFYGQYSNETFRLDGKPLLTSFNPLYLPTNSTFTYRSIGGLPNQVDWVFWSGWHFNDSYGPKAQPWNYENPPIIRGGEVGIIPRYDDYYQRGQSGNFMRFDYNMTQGLYIAEWNYVIQNKNDVRLVLIYSWNEYHERSELEPHTDFNSGPVSELNLTNQFAHLLNG